MISSRWSTRAEPEYVPIVLVARTSGGCDVIIIIAHIVAEGVEKEQRLQNNLNEIKRHMNQIGDDIYIHIGDKIRIVLLTKNVSPKSGEELNQIFNINHTIVIYVIGNHISVSI